MTTALTVYREEFELTLAFQLELESWMFHLQSNVERKKKHQKQMEIDKQTSNGTTPNNSVNLKKHYKTCPHCHADDNLNNYVKCGQCGFDFKTGKPKDDRPAIPKNAVATHKEFGLIEKDRAIELENMGRTWLQTIPATFKDGGPDISTCSDIEFAEFLVSFNAAYKMLNELKAVRIKSVRSKEVEEIKIEGERNKEATIEQIHPDNRTIPQQQKLARKVSSDTTLSAKLRDLRKKVIMMGWDVVIPDYLKMNESQLTDAMRKAIKDGN